MHVENLATIRMAEKLQRQRDRDLTNIQIEKRLERIESKFTKVIKEQDARLKLSLRASIEQKRKLYYKKIRYAQNVKEFFVPHSHKGSRNQMSSL